MGGTTPRRAGTTQSSPRAGRKRRRRRSPHRTGMQRRLAGGEDRGGVAIHASAECLWTEVRGGGVHREAGATALAARGGQESIAGRPRARQRKGPSRRGTPRGASAPCPLRGGLRRRAPLPGKRTPPRGVGDRHHDRNATSTPAARARGGACGMHTSAAPGKAKARHPLLATPDGGRRRGRLHPLRPDRPNLVGRPNTPAGQGNPLRRRRCATPDEFVRCVARLLRGVRRGVDVTGDEDGREHGEQRQEQHFNPLHQANRYCR